MSYCLFLDAGQQWVKPVSPFSSQPPNPKPLSQIDLRDFVPPLPLFLKKQRNSLWWIQSSSLSGPTNRSPFFPDQFLPLEPCFSIQGLMEVSSVSRLPLFPTFPRFPNNTAAALAASRRRDLWLSRWPAHTPLVTPPPRRPERGRSHTFLFCHGHRAPSSADPQPPPSPLSSAIIRRSSVGEQLTVRFAVFHA